MKIVNVCQGKEWWSDVRQSLTTPHAKNWKISTKYSFHLLQLKQNQQETILSHIKSSSENILKGIEHRKAVSYLSSIKKLSLCIRLLDSLK
jgi:hypothetical protein